MTVVVIGDNTGDDYSGTEDVELMENQPNTNQDGRDYYVSSYNTLDFRHIWLKFSGVSNLPSALTVNSATISLYHTANSGVSKTWDVSKVLRAAVEGEATWNIYSTGNAWTTGGGISAGNDIAASPITTFSPGTSTGAYKTITGLATDIEDFADGTTTNNGHLIHPQSGTFDFNFDQFRHSGGADGQRPYLTVDYTATGGGGTILPLLNAYYG